MPAFKEVTEQLFCDGLVKLVFATETLALGINMPARTVVLDRLSKFTGEGHELMLPGEFTQLTGRAGRRGIDTVGHGVVLHSRFVSFERMVSIADLGSHPLRSSFRPTYNMVVNLIANYPRSQTERLLEASFAEFQRRRAARKKPKSRRTSRQRSSLVGRFHRSRRLLEEKGYLQGWKLLAPGEALRVVYNEMDFFLVEALRAGIFDYLTPPELGALISMFVYEPRRDDDPVDELPTETLEGRWKDLVDLWRRHTEAEKRYRLPSTRRPQPGFAHLAYAWAQHQDLEVLIEEEGLAPGDFVRNARQVLDVLRQIRDATQVLGLDGFGESITPLQAAIDRGVVAAGGGGG